MKNSRKFPEEPHLKASPENSGLYLAASDGSQMLGLFGGAIIQNTTISLAAGTRYLLSFDQSAPQEVIGTAPEDALLNIFLAGNTQTLSESFLVPYATPSWVHREYEFQAEDSTVYSVSFVSPQMSLIDNVWLVAVPEPSTTALSFSGMLALWLLGQPQPNRKSITDRPGVQMQKSR